MTQFEFLFLFFPVSFLLRLNLIFPGTNKLSIGRSSVFFSYIALHCIFALLLLLLPPLVLFLSLHVLFFFAFLFSVGNSNPHSVPIHTQSKAGRKCISVSISVLELAR